MKNKSYKGAIALIVAAVAAVHVVLFARHPHLPPAARSEVVWGDLSSTQPPPAQGSPVNISPCADKQQAAEDNAAATDTLNRVRFEYRPEADTFVNTGSAAEIEMARGSSITIGDKIYPLQQIRFEKSDARGTMAFYLIHQVNDGGAVVVTVPLQIADRGNPVFDTLWHYLPERAGEHNSLDDIHVDINKLLPQDRTFYRYASNSACTVVLGLEKPVQITSVQAAMLNRVLAEQHTTRS